MFRMPVTKVSGQILGEGIDTLLDRILKGKQIEAENNYKKATYGLEREKLPFQKALLSSQALEAQSKAEKDSALLNAMRQLYDLENPSSNVPSTNQPSLTSGVPTYNYGGSQPDQVTNANIARNAGTYNPSDVNVGQATQINPSQINEDKKKKLRDFLIANKIIQETPTEQEERETSTAWKKELAAIDVKQLDNWNNAISSNKEIQPVLEHNQEILANPKLKDLYKNPEYFGVDIVAAKRLSKDPEIVDLLSTLATNSKSVFSAMSKDFKGQFKQFEYNLLNNAAIDETKDTLQQMISKTNTALAIRSLVTKRLGMADQIVRDSKGKISPSKALDIADSLVDGKKVRAQIKSRFEKEQKEQEIAKKLAEKNKTKKSESQKTVIVIDPKGIEHEGPADQLDKMLSDPEFKGWRKK